MDATPQNSPQPFCFCLCRFGYTCILTGLGCVCQMPLHNCTHAYVHMCLSANTCLEACLAGIGSRNQPTYWHAPRWYRVLELATKALNARLPSSETEFTQWNWKMATVAGESSSIPFPLSTPLLLSPPSHMTSSKHGLLPTHACPPFA